MNDIIAELVKPGRDIRDSLPQRQLRKDIMSIDDLEVGMVVEGTVRNVIDFGAFVDISVPEERQKLFSLFIRFGMNRGIVHYILAVWNSRLDSVLGGVLEDCVNSVGVDLNTASVSVLKYVPCLPCRYLLK